MKKCPKCGKEYDNSWGVCLTCETPLQSVVYQPVQFPLSASKSRTAFDVSSKLIFLPTDDFYSNWDASPERLMQMMKDIFVWLNMTDHDFYGGYSHEINCPGLYCHDGNKDVIIVHSKYSENPFEVASILAHECVHHFMRIYNIWYPDRLENEKKTDLTTISCGLGVIYINGMYYESNWWVTALALFAGSYVVLQEKKSFGYFKAEDYCKNFASYLKQKNINGSDIMGFVHPKARSFLPIGLHFTAGRKRPAIIKKLEERSNRNLVIQIAAVAIVAILVLGSILIPTKYSQERTEASTQLTEAKKVLDDLEIKIKVASEKINHMKSKLENYERMGDYENCNNLVEPYNQLILEAKKYYADYEEARNKYNASVRVLNKGK